jgi:hypothetical protein
MVTAAHPPARRRAQAEFRGVDLATQPVPPEPHPELGTDTAALHGWLVESAVFFHGDDAAAISAAVCLPLWNVRRSLHALGLGTAPTPRPTAVRAKYGSRKVKAAAYLREHGPATAPQVAAGCGFNPTSAVHMLKGNPDLFKAVRLVRRRGKPMTIWGVVA